MAINIKAMKGAMVPSGGVAYSAVPPGWNYDARTDQYVDSIGRYVSKQDVDTYGGIIQAILSIHGPMAIQSVQGATSGSNQMVSAPGANGPAGPFSASISSAANVGSLSVVNAQAQPYAFHNPPTSVIAIETKLGRISVDIETGDITVPVGVGRDDAIREFWFGFQKHFVPSNKAKYEEEIKFLKRDLASTKASAVLMKEEGQKNANKRVAEKVRQKYGNEKFIMLKPDDLIRFIEEA